MLTQCSHCRAVFRIRAAHLVVARGHVECGACGKGFFALDRLADEPASRTVEEAPATAEPPLMLQSAPEEPALAGPARLDPPAVPNADANAAGKRRRAAQRAERRWGDIARFLLLVFAAQVLWAARESLWQRFPTLVPPLRAQCAQWECAALLKLPAPRVVLLEEDLRDHPAREDALLWNATLHNAEISTAPWPALELRLERPDGTPVAVRRFAPRDYLGGAEPPGDLEPDARASVTLELRRPGAAADRYRAFLR